jgi:hypothetical protein
VIKCAGIGKYHSERIQFSTILLKFILIVGFV